MFVTFIIIAIISSLVKFDHYRDTRAAILDPCIQGILNFETSLYMKTEDRKRNRLNVTLEEDNRFSNLSSRQKDVFVLISNIKIAAASAFWAHPPPMTLFLAANDQRSV